jgi:chaperone required for assembly of F1-ATPase
MEATRLKRVKMIIQPETFGELREAIEIAAKRDLETTVTSGTAPNVKSFRFSPSEKVVSDHVEKTIAEVLSEKTKAMSEDIFRLLAADIFKNGVSMEEVLNKNYQVWKKISNAAKG